MATNQNKLEPELSWSARRMSPRIILYVAIIFIIFILISYFIFHSISAVKTLAITAIGAIITLLPNLFTRMEYKLTKEKLCSRAVINNKNDLKPYKVLFTLNNLSYIVKIENGFKYYLQLSEKKPISRFWKLNISNKYSGEVKLEKKDVERILIFFNQNEVLIREK